MSLGSTTRMYSMSVWWGVWCAWLLNTDFWSFEKSPCWFSSSEYILLYVDMGLILFYFLFEIEVQCWFVYVEYSGRFGEYVSATGRVPSTQEQGKRGVALGDLKTQQKISRGCIISPLIEQADFGQQHMASEEFRGFYHVTEHLIKCWFWDPFSILFPAHCLQIQLNLNPQRFLLGFSMVGCSESVSF